MTARLVRIERCDACRYDIDEYCSVRRRVTPPTGIPEWCPLPRTRTRKKRVQVRARLIRVK